MTVGSKEITGSLQTLDGITGFTSKETLTASTDLSVDHLGNILVYDGTADITLTIPDSIDLDSPVFAGFGLMQLGPGKIVLAGAAGVSVGFGTYTPYRVSRIRRVEENLWFNENLYVIEEPVTLNVSTTGSADPQNPLRGDAFSLPSLAAEYLRKYAIKAPVTIQVGAGTFTETDLDLGHADGGKYITWQGDGIISITAAAMTNSGGANRLADNTAIRGQLLADYSTIIRVDGTLSLMQSPSAINDILFDGLNSGNTVEYSQNSDDELHNYRRNAWYGFARIRASDYVNLYLNRCVLAGQTVNHFRCSAPGTFITTDSYFLGAGNNGIYCNSPGLSMFIDSFVLEGAVGFGFYCESGYGELCLSPADILRVANCGNVGIYLAGVELKAKGTWISQDCGDEGILLVSCKGTHSSDFEMRVRSDAAGPQIVCRNTTIIYANNASQLTIDCQNSAGTAPREARVEGGASIYISPGVAQIGTFVPAINTTAFNNSIWYQLPVGGF